MSAKVGTHLGPYEIVSRAGAGGMGEVWKARDTRLGRTVAIKISDQKFTDRFDCEARAVAALNHPHISALYDIGPDYLVMEYVEGEPLKGPLPLAKALEYAKQILDALHAAHRAGIVHRDLKPANILVAKSGVKVLDFGLAKRTEAASASVDGLPDLGTRSLSGEGHIVGTLHYMAPEQLQAKHVDARADIFAFGCVLYEMITGKRAFDGGSPASVIAAVLERPAPSISDIAPEPLDRILKRCLAKDPEERWQSALDVKINLEWVAMETPKIPAPRFRWFGWATALATAILLAVAALGLSGFFERQPHAIRMQFQELPPYPSRFVGGPSVSPDGRCIAFQAYTPAPGRSGLLAVQIWVRALDRTRARPLSGTEGAESLFWSPDSRSIGFSASGSLKKVDIQTGIVQVLASLPGPADSPGAWGSRGDIIFPVQRQGLFRVSEAGGSLTQLTNNTGAQRDTLQFSPSFLPDGRHFLFCSFGPVQPGIYMISVDAPAGSTPALIKSGSYDGAAYVNPGYVVMLRGSALLAQKFDPKNLHFRGEPFPISEQSFTAGDYWEVLFNISVNGSLAYRPGIQVRRDLISVDRAGNALSKVAPAGYYSTLALSADGKRLALSRTDEETQNYDIWVLDLTRSAWSRISFDPSTEHWPVWSPDGTRLVYESHRNNVLALYEKLVDSPAPDHLFVELNRENGACAWSPSGREILYWAFDPKTKADVWIVPVKGERKPVPLLQSPFNEYCGEFSPDEHFLAYASDETGRFEVFVQELARGPEGTLRASGRRWQISTTGGIQPRWRRDGKEIFFFGDIQSGKGKIMSAAVRRSGAGLEIGSPVALFNWGTPDYVVSPDGQRFLMAIRPDAIPAAAVAHAHQRSIEPDQRGPDPADSAATVILNLFADKKR